MALFLRFTAIPAQVGPGVRIRLAPAGSHLRTRLLMRHFGPCAGTCDVVPMRPAQPTTVISEVAVFRGYGPRISFPRASGLGSAIGRSDVAGRSGRNAPPLGARLNPLGSRRRWP